MAAEKLPAFSYFIHWEKNSYADMNMISSPIFRIPFFDGLHSEDVAFLDSIAGRETVEAGDPLFEKGGDAEYLYIVESGTLALQLPRDKKDPISLMTLNPGELIGWSWLFPPYKWNFDARALNECELLTLDTACIRRRMDCDPGFGFRIMQSLVGTMHDRLTATRLQLLRHHDD